MVRRAYDICSNETELHKELNHLKDVFTTTNGYPRNLVSNVMKKAKDEQEKEETLTPPQET